MHHPLLFLKAFGSWVVLGGVFLDLTLLPFPSEILLVAKFFPGLRTIVPSLAGAAAMSYGAFLRADGVGTTLWVIAFSGLGYVLAGQVRDIIAALQGVQAAALWIVGGVAVGLSVFGQVWVRRRIRCLGPAAAMRLASPREGSPSAPRAQESNGMRFSPSTDLAECVNDGGISWPPPPQSSAEGWRPSESRWAGR